MSFQCPITGKFCLKVKTIPVVDSNTNLSHKVCIDCAQQVLGGPMAKEAAWKSFLHNIFVQLHIDKVLSPDELLNAIDGIKNHNELNDFLEMLASRKQRIQSLPPCPSCGIDLKAILTYGKLGCQVCYKHFSEFCKVIIQKSQEGASKHVGKVPKNLDVNSLEEAMNRAAKEERYEDAAKFRDQIRVIRSSASQSSSQGQ